MREHVLKLNAFCLNNDIDFVLTGTAALALQGAIPAGYEVKDLDIKLVDHSPEGISKLRELEALLGTKSHSYADSDCITFKVDNLKVNAIVVKDQCIGCQTMLLGPDVNTDLVKVQIVGEALKDKMMLNRVKDKDFMMSLVRNFLSLCKND